MASVTGAPITGGAFHVTADGDAGTALAHVASDQQVAGIGAPGIPLQGGLQPVQAQPDVTFGAQAQPPDLIAQQAVAAEDDDYDAD